jgi:hypothetical protein
MRHDSTCYHFSHDTEAMLVAKVDPDSVVDFETMAMIKKNMLKSHLMHFYII